MSVVAKLRTMSVMDYDRERLKIKETYGDSEKEAGARWEQNLVALFVRSGWTQQELADKESKSQQRIGQLLRFGKFLSQPFVDLEETAKLNEKLFRKYWESAEGDNETTRYHTVMDYVTGKRKLAPTPKKPVDSKPVKNEDHNPNKFSKRPDQQEDEEEADPWDEPKPKAPKSNVLTYRPIIVSEDEEETAILQQFEDGEPHSVTDVATALNKAVNETKEKLRSIQKRKLKLGVEVTTSKGIWQITPKPTYNREMVDNDMISIIEEMRAEGHDDLADKLQTLWEGWGA